MLSKSALLHVTGHARHGNHRSSSILYLSNRLFLVCFEILLKLQDKRVCRYLDVLIHSTVRRNKLTQSKIRWSQKREGGQKWNSREQWSVISNSIYVIFRSFQVRQMLSLQKRRLERKESRKFPWRCSSRRVSFQACFNHCLRNFSLCSVIKVSLVLAVLIVSYTLKKGVLYVGCMVCSSHMRESDHPHKNSWIYVSTGLSRQ